MRPFCPRPCTGESTRIIRTGSLVARGLGGAGKQGNVLIKFIDDHPTHSSRWWGPLSRGRPPLPPDQEEYLWSTRPRLTPEMEVLIPTLSRMALPLFMECCGWHSLPTSVSRTSTGMAAMTAKYREGGDLQARRRHSAAARVRGWLVRAPRIANIASIFAAV